MAQSSVLKN